LDSSSGAKAHLDHHREQLRALVPVGVDHVVTGAHGQVDVLVDLFGEPAQVWPGDLAQVERIGDEQPERDRARPQRVGPGAGQPHRADLQQRLHQIVRAAHRQRQIRGQVRQAAPLVVVREVPQHGERAVEASRIHAEQRTTRHGGEFA
jgi:hypothetical protein